jgi:hypothetical protein
MSDDYFDKYLFEGRPDLLREVAKAMVGLLPTECEVLAGMEMGGTHGPDTSPMNQNQAASAYLYASAATRLVTSQDRLRRTAPHVHPSPDHYVEHVTVGAGETLSVESPFAVRVEVDDLPS